MQELIPLLLELLFARYAIEITIHFDVLAIIQEKLRVPGPFNCCFNC